MRRPKITSILEIHRKDSRVIAGRAEFAKGSPANVNGL